MTVVMKSMDFGARLLGFESQLCHLLDLPLWDFISTSVNSRDNHRKDLLGPLWGLSDVKCVRVLRIIPGI